MIQRSFAFALVALAVYLGLFGVAGRVDAQQLATPRRIGVLVVGFSPEGKEAQAFRQGLRDAGYAERRDVVIEWRSASGDYARVPELVADLLQRKVDVIVATSTLAAQAVKRATSTIPIVMAVVADPVGSNLVANLAHPGGNVTGFSLMTVDLSAKRLQLLRETIPRLARVAVLWNPATPWHPKVIEDLKAVAPSLSIEFKLLGTQTPEELSAALSAASRARAQALYLIEDHLFLSHRTTLFKLASNARLPAIYGARQYTDEGGRMSSVAT